jgi:hypothetical protein
MYELRLLEAARGFFQMTAYPVISRPCGRSRRGAGLSTDSHGYCLVAQTSLLLTDAPVGSREGLHTGNGGWRQSRKIVGFAGSIGFTQHRRATMTAPIHTPPLSRVRAHARALAASHS